ncbi:hypothetical protein HDU92_002599 [Lobulomyces angularis]|nr:hypothetical protein HDU92_002599 [Lobulomyces angularis]
MYKKLKQVLKRRSSFLITLILFIYLVNVNQVLCTLIIENAQLIDRQAAFGPILKAPLNGTLMFMYKGCKVNFTKERPSDFIALVERGDCSFVDKVRAMQNTGAIAVIVGDNTNSVALITMYASDESTSDIFIPSVFIAKWELISLREWIYENITYISLVPNELDLPLFQVILITIITPVIVLSIFYLLWFYRDYISKRKEMASVEEVSNLPCKVFDGRVQSENFQAQGCAICLDDFAVGDHLRILLCNHEFHIHCVDRWLTKRKRTCPICKKSTIKDAVNSTSIEEANTRNISFLSEITPLLNNDNINSTTN